MFHVRFIVRVWRGGGRVIGDTKEEIVTQLNDLIYGDDPYDLSDIEDIIGDGDPFEYL
jgi:hypothetical protein